MANAYTFIAESSTGSVIKEQEVQAYGYLEARRAFWLGLTDSERDACASVECIDEKAD